jgi:hypothetical protein
MVPGGRRYQAATQVKGWSPEIFNVIEADIFHVHGRQHGYTRNGEGRAALSGSETAAWYQRAVWEPGRSGVLSRMGGVADNPKRRGSHEGALEVGPTHSRGVVRVMPGAGMRLTRRGWQLHAERGGNTHHA